MYKLKETTKENFLTLDPIRRIISSIYPRKFSILEIGKFKYGLSWRSDLVDPVILELEAYQLFVIGVDESVVALRTDVEKIEFAMGLLDPILELSIYESNFFVFTETTATAVNIENCSINNTIAFPDIYDSYTIENGNVIIHTLEGSTYIF